MTRLAAIAGHLDAETLALVERVALARGISSDAFAADAVRRAAEDEAEFWAAVQEGVDDLDAGRVVAHGVVMAKLDGMRAKYEARCRE